MSATHARCYASDLVPARRTSEKTGGYQSSAGVKDPIGDCKDGERTRGSGSYKGQRFVVSLSSWSGYFPPLMFHEIPEQTQTNIIAFAIYNLILIEKLSVGWAGQPSSIRLDITREMKRKGCKV